MTKTTEKKFTISVILPIKSGKANGFTDYFTKCIESIKTQESKINELIIVHTNEDYITEYLKSFDFGDINVQSHPWTGEPNFAEQVNYGVEQSKSEWISLLEFDDEYSKIWFKNVEKYSSVYPDCDAFLPIVVDVDEKSMFVGFTNEASFALNVSSEMGVLTNETLHQFQNFQIAGMAFKKEKYIEYGKIKPSFKLTFGYEFFLRMTYNMSKIMTIPRIGYKHMNLREGSIFWNYKNGDNILSENEVKFWIESAKKEYFFNKDRQIKYVPESI